MEFISLDEAIHAVAARIGLPEFLGDETRTYERAGVVVEFEQDYLYACRYSFAAAVLHQCITNSTAPLRWWSMHPDTGMAVIGDSVDEEGLAILVRFARLIRREQERASNHFLFACADGPFLGEDELPRRKPRTIDLTKLYDGMGGLFETQPVGLVSSELARLLDANRVAHTLETGPAATNNSAPGNPPPPSRPEDTSSNRAEPHGVRVVTAGESNGSSWSLKTPARYPGYRKQLHDVLKAAHAAGEQCPKARDVLEAWGKTRPYGVTEVMSDGLKYEDAKGNTQTADLKAIQQAIKALTT